jgi:hypothetical protein
MGPLPRPVGVCEGSEMRLTRRVLSPIIFSLSLSAASAQNLSVNGLEKSEAYLLSTYRNVCEKGINGIQGTNCIFKFQDAVLAVFVGRGAQPDPLRPDKEWVLLPMVNFNIRPPRRHRKQRGEKPISPAGKADHSFQGRKNARVQVCYAAKPGGFLQNQS